MWCLKLQSDMHCDPRSIHTWRAFVVPTLNAHSTNVNLNKMELHVVERWIAVHVTTYKTRLIVEHAGKCPI